MSETIKLKIDGINRERGENEIILYNNCYGTTSKCNAWGYEIAINKKGLICECKSIVSKMPKNGYIVSLHGDSNTRFAIDNFKLGQKVEVNMPKASLLIHKEIDKKTALLQEYSTLKKSFNKAIKNLENIDYSVIEDLNLLKDNINGNDLSYDYQKQIKKIKLKLFPSRMIENRGIWHRPHEKNCTEIKKTIERLKKAHITSIYIESDVDSYLVYQYKKFEVYPLIDNNYDGKDYLSFFIEEAHKNDIEVFLWDKIFNFAEKLYDKYKKFQIKYYNNKNYKSMLVDGLSFLDPSISQVRTLILNKTKYLLKHYNLDGYQLDYIRYPAGNKKIETSSGYDEKTIHNFENKYHTTIEKDYDLWSKYRSDFVTKMVQKVCTYIIKNKPNIFTSISVFSDIEEANKDKLQYWQKWVKKGYIDIVELMAYYFDESYVKKDSLKLDNISKNRCFNYTGIAPTYSKLNDMENAYHINGANQGRAQGSMIFCSDNLTDDVIEILSHSVYRTKNTRPHSDLLSLKKAIKEELTYSFDNTYIRLEKATEKDKNAFLNILDDALSQNNLLDSFDSIITKIDFLNTHVNKSIVSHLNYYKKIMHIRNNRQNKRT